MQFAGMGDVLRPERMDHYVAEEPGLAIEQSQHVRDREPAAGLLVARLTEGRLKLGRVRHGKPRAILQQDAMAVPERRFTGTVKLLIELVDQVLQQLQRQSLSGLTVGRGRE